MLNLLWSGWPKISTKAKVRWEVICTPMKEGGLGIPKLGTWNKAAKLKHMWKLCSNDYQSFWVDSVHTIYLKGRNF